MPARSARSPGGKKDNSPTGEGGSTDLAAPPELVVVTRQEAAVHADAGGGFASRAGESTQDLEMLLADHGATLRPVLGLTAERLLAATAMADFAAEGPATELANFYTVAARADQMEELRSDLESQDLVEAAYIKPGAEPAVLNDMTAAPEEAPPATPDLSARQLYLDAAPGGIEARWAWTQNGGGGANVRIIDIEGAWRFTHEDLVGNQGGVVGGTQSSNLAWRNHGTAVVGEYGGDRNSFGITGISPDAHASAVSIFNSGGGASSSAAIAAAAARLRPGDIILLELHRPGPRFNFQGRADQAGYIAIEWWPDDYAAIVAAVARGIIVVEAAGNGAENLDDAIYQNPAPGFPSGWSNPFRRANRDSGAIMVGAGAPPPGTHGRNHGADRSRLGFSNFGALIDAQGWGREVTTAGYGDLQGGSNEDLWYTDTFSGTSSASPIVVGAVASLQGMALARGRPPLTPAQVRNCLRTTGSPQQDEPGRPSSQRIGNRPNLRQLAACAFGPTKDLRKEMKDRKDVTKDFKDKEKELIKDTKDTKDSKDQKDRKDRKEKEKELIKDNKDTKDRKDQKDRKEGKDGKEKELAKEIKDRKDSVEKTREIFSPTAEGEGGGLEERVAAVEAVIEQLVHFIGEEHRPDLSSSALMEESQQLGEADEEAKVWKDHKDSESC